MTRKGEQAPHITPDERAHIEDLLRTGLSASKVAKQVGRGQATVSRIARAAGLQAKNVAAENARAALADYNLVRRVGLLNQLFTKAETMIGGVRKPSELHQLAIATAILIDKRRLEDGEATSRSENYDHDSARSQLAARLDELAARRARGVGSESDRAAG